MARSAYKTAGNYTPKQGNRALAIQYNFAVQALFADDLTAEMQQGEIDIVQSVYVDNSKNPNPLTIQFLYGPQQPLVVPGLAQGVYPVIVAGIVRYTISTTIGGVIVTLVWQNIQQTYTQWGPINLNVANVNPAQGTFTDRSGNITVGGTSQILAAANAARKLIQIENPATALGQNIAAAESLFINFTAGAGVNNGTSFELTPGGYWPPAGQNVITTEAITVNAATTGHRWIAKEM